MCPVTVCASTSRTAANCRFPSSWFTWLRSASESARADVQVIEFGLGIWWETLDEGVSVPWLLGLPHH